jgi:hypothetical protein
MSKLDPILPTSSALASLAGGQTTLTYRPALNSSWRPIDTTEDYTVHAAGRPRTSITRRVSAGRRDPLGQCAPRRQPRPGWCGMSRWTNTGPWSLAGEVNEWCRPSPDPGFSMVDSASTCPVHFTPGFIFPGHGCARVQDGQMKYFTLVADFTPRCTVSTAAAG